MTVRAFTYGALLSEFYLRKEQSGSNDPQARSRDNPYNMAYVRVEQEPIRFTNFTYPFIPPYYESWGFGTPDFQSVVDMPAADGNAVLRAMSKIREQLAGHDFNASLAFADVEKTSEMVYRSGKRCIDFLSALARFDFIRALRLIPKIVQGSENNAALKRAMKQGNRSRDVSDTWLAAQYGWSPLISDFQEALVAWKIRHMVPRRTKYRARAKGPGQWFDLRATGGRQACMALVQEDVSVVVTLKETGVAPTFSLLGMNLESIFSVVWERTPWSFVLDWFIPIGNAIQEWVFFRGVDMSLCTTIVQYARGSGVSGTGVYPEFVDGNGNTKPGVTLGSSHWYIMRMKRTVSDHLDFVIPSVKHLGRALSDRHLQNLAALIYSGLPHGGKVVRPF